MLDFATSFLGWLAATAIPAFLGLSLIIVAGRVVRPRYICAFALGIFLWFFVDTIQGSADLYVGAGYAGGIDQVAIVLLFVVGVMTLFVFTPKLFSDGSERYASSLRLPIIIALAVGIHGLGEGAAFGGTAVFTSSSSLLDAFGGLSAGVAYALHKALEPMMIGAVYVAYRRADGMKAPKLADLLLLTGLFALPSLIGAVTAYFISYDSTYFFALGTGTSALAALSLSRPLFQNAGTPDTSQSAKLGICLVVGFLAIYLAALLHS